MTITPPPSAAPSDKETAERIVASLLDRVGKAMRAHENGQKNLCAEYLADLMLEPARIAASAERTLSTARREARAAAIEECAKVADDWGYRHLYREPEESLVHRSEQIAAAGFISHAIRALLPAPEPTQEHS